MKNEEWRDIKDFEELYQVSSMGRVKSLERKDCLGRTVKERILKPGTDQDGYLRVALCNGSGKPKTFKIHRLVCQAFHENSDNKPQVNHLNEDKKDNRACNLEWCTVKENLNHGTRNERAGEGIAKVFSKRVGQYTLDGELIKIWASTQEVKRQTGFSQGNVSQAARGKLKTAYGFVWRYGEREEED